MALTATVDRATRILAIAAGVLLVLMVLVITVGVGARYFLGNPILGINEIVQMNAVALAMLAMPYATAQQIHVRADIFDRFLGRWGRFLADIATRLLSIVALWLLCGRVHAKTLDALEFGDATNILNLPIWPLYALVEIGMALCILVFAVQTIAILIRGRSHDD